jgi:hypothetical protein
MERRRRSDTVDDVSRNRVPGKAPSDAPGEHLVRELRWVHGMLRRDLKVISALADQVGAGGTPRDVGKAVRSLQANSPLWQLRVNCLRYCSFVHSHHGNEDVSLFPSLRRSNPALGPVVDKLEADHRAVSDLLDQVEALARLIAGEDNKQNRDRLVTALRTMGTTLLAHLDFEERSISPALRQWRRWPT